MVFKFAYFVELRIDYHPAEFQCCRLPLANFIDRLRKHNDDGISCCWDFKILTLVKLNIGYQPSKFQISWLSGSNFMEISVRHQKHHYDIIMMSFLTTEFPNQHIL